MPYAAQKRRPRAWWFVLGGGLMLAALIVFAVTVASFVHEIAHTDARFAAEGTHQVVLPAHDERGLFVYDLGPLGNPCTARDDRGTRVAMRLTDDGDDVDGWVLVARFDTGDGHLTFSCDGGEGGFSGQDVRIAAVPDGSDVARLGLLGAVVPGLLGFAGFAVVLVTGILWVSRRRPPPPPPYAPPGHLYPPPGPPYVPPGPPPARP
jgi:hypothetical protein